MKVRFSLVSLGLCFLTTASAPAQPVWTGTIDGSLNTLLNWTGGAPTAADLTFTTTIRPLVTVDASISVKSLTFSGLYPSYSFSSPNASVLSIGSSGITAGAQGTSIVNFASTLTLQLAASQIWAVDSLLNVASPIKSAPAATTVLTKTGSGTLALSGNSTYNGGTIVQLGSLIVDKSSVDSAGAVTSGPIGTGPLTIGANTTFGAVQPGIVLGNDVSLATGSTLVSGSNLANGVGLTFTGKVTAATNSLLITLVGSDPVTFAGLLDGPTNTGVVFRSGSASAWDGAAFAGSTGPNVTSIMADDSALFFASA
ncbi:MAG: autotransporter-associated beta strand repeat-containing protein, partial [Opitutus sp.]